MYYKIVSRKSCDFYTMCIFFNLEKRTVYQLCQLPVKAFPKLVSSFLLIRLIFTLTKHETKNAYMPCS